MSEGHDFSLRITPAGAGVDQAEVEQLAIQLRRDLLASGIPGVTRVVEGQAPDGTRSIELIATGIDFLVTGLSAAASVVQITDYVQRWREAHPRRRRVVVSVEAGATSGGSRVSGTAGRRTALLVANAAYRDPGLSRLRSPVSDIRALAEVLGEPGIGAFDVETLTDADESVLRRRVAALFADRQPDDVLLLHFSCHGLKDQRGRLYLAAADTELGSLAATGLPASFVSEQMSESASRSVLLVLDCCYSGAFARDTPVRADRTVYLGEEFRGGGSGRTVLTASSATEYAFEGGQLTSYEAEPSVFTEALVHGLRTGGADLDHDGEITVDELFDYVARRVREAGVGQVPRKWSFETTGALVVARSVRPATLPEEVRADLGSDRPVLRLEAVRALAELLAGGREGYRRAAREALVRLRDDDDSLQVRRAAAAALGDVAPPRPPAPAVQPPAIETPAIETPAVETFVMETPVVEASAIETSATETPVIRTPAVEAPRVEAPPRPLQVQQPLPSARAARVPVMKFRRLLVVGVVGLVVAVSVTIAIVSNQRQSSDSASSGGPGLGQMLTSVTLSHNGSIEYAGLSPDGRWAVTLDAPKDRAAAQVAGLWDASSGLKVATFDTDRGVVFSPDGSAVAVAHYEGKREVTTVNGEQMGVLIGGTTTVSLRKTSGGEVVASFTDHKGSAIMAFSPDSKTVATAGTLASEKSFASPIRLWDVSTGKQLATLTGHENGIQSMRFSKDGNVLVTGAAGGVTKVWDVAAGEATATLDNAWFPVWVSPDGKTFADTRPGDKDGFELRRVPDGKRLALVTKAGTFAGFTPGSEAYATGNDGNVRLFDLATRKARVNLTARVEGDPVFSPDGKLIAAVTKEGAPALFDAVTGQGLTQLTGHGGTVTDLTFAADGQTLYTIGTDKTVRKWSVTR
ncbi:caspase, EACC1-associated type [Nonomuraea endophytica]|uniref:WD40 repeat protein n=1 Tax=Nonomuraea endophytica TaxID=714136 RepID=A0A7W8EHF4_9ACTN|nr:caspase family protein [Nonomuraea endophytica]MBB5079478.1 WD40 repeat protein [Nonomuraea endophytica]